MDPYLNQWDLKHQLHLHMEPEDNLKTIIFPEYNPLGWNMIEKYCVFQLTSKKPLLKAPMKITELENA